MSDVELTWDEAFADIREYARVALEETRRFEAQVLGIRPEHHGKTFGLEIAKPSP